MMRPCNHFAITRSAGVAVCRLHFNLPPQCLCADYSPDYEHCSDSIRQTSHPRTQPA